MEQKKYTPIIDSETEYTLVPKSGANYEKIKMITLKSSTSNLAQKMSIIKEFNLDYNPDIFNQFANLNSEEKTPEEKLKLLKDFKISKTDQYLYASEYGLKEYTEKITAALFLGKIDPKFDVLNLDEITRALSDFFSVGGNGTESFSKN